METEIPFFILGLPRSRTAWLSVVASMCGAQCVHEGVRGFDDFEHYADTRFALGDADPALIFWTAEILARWPDARFVVVERDDHQSLESMVRASPPDAERGIRAGWEQALQAFSVTRDLLRDYEGALFVTFESLMDAGMIRRIIEHIGGAVPAAAMVERWQRLKVTSTIQDVERVKVPRREAAAHFHLFARSGCSSEGLSATPYAREEFAIVSQWWRAHTGQSLKEAALPPLGVIVSLNGLPVAALWCYESFGVPVAELAFPVTKPGLTVKDARRALLYAVSVAVNAAGKGHTPEAAFRVFKVQATEGMARFLEPLGFQRTPDRVRMILEI